MILPIQWNPENTTEYPQTGIAVLLPVFEKMPDSLLDPFIDGIRNIQAVEAAAPDSPPPVFFCCFHGKSPVIKAVKLCRLVSQRNRTVGIPLSSDVVNQTGNPVRIFCK